MKIIPLTQEKSAIIDDEDFEKVNNFKWEYSAGTGYARCRRKGSPTVYMHRFINNTPKGKITDHINRNKLDNRRCNLRSVTKVENQRNHNIFKTNVSSINGVSWNKAMKKWETYIWRFNKKITIGYFKTLTIAAKNRRNAELIYW